MKNRVHKNLRAEELEARVAPVTLSAGNPTYSFMNKSGDELQIQYSGPGTADVQWEKGGATPFGNDEIAGINLAGTTQASKLTLKDMNPGIGQDRITGGTIKGTQGESFGSIEFETPHYVSGTSVTIHGNLGTMSVEGDAKVVTLWVGGDLGKQVFGGYANRCGTFVQGDTSLIAVAGGNAGFYDSKIYTTGNVTSMVFGTYFGYGSKMDIGGSVNSIKIGGSIKDASIKIAGDLGNMYAGDKITKWIQNSVIQIGGNAKSLKFDAAMDNSILKVSGDLSLLDVNGTVKGGSEIEIGGAAKSIKLYNVTSDTKISIAGDLGTFAIDGNSWASAQEMKLDIGGSAKSIKIPGALTDSDITVAGDVSTVSIGASVMNKSSIVVGGKANSIKVGGGFNQSLIQTGGDLGTITVGYTMDNQAVLAVGGNAKSITLKKGIYGLNCMVAVKGDVSTVTVGDLLGYSLVSSYIKIDGAVNSIKLTGDVLQKSGIGVGSAKSIKIGGDVKDSTVTAFTTAIDTLQIGGMASHSKLHFVSSIKIAGAMEYASAGGMDVKYFSAASMTKSSVKGVNSIGSAYCMGDMIDSWMATNGSAGLYYVGGNMTLSPNNMILSAFLRTTQGLGKLEVKGDSTHVQFEIGGDLGQAKFGGSLTDSNLTVDGKVSSLQAAGGQFNSNFALNGGANQIQLGGGFANSSLIVKGDVAKLTFDGSIQKSSWVQVTGDTGSFSVTEGIKEATKVRLEGQVTNAQIAGPKDSASLAADSTLTMGSLKKSLIFTGDLAGIADIENSAAGSTIQIKGDLTGYLLAGVFGNVKVNGKFSGKIGDLGTAPGTGNSLKISQPGGGGVVTLENSFAKYIGY